LSEPNHAGSPFSLGLGTILSDGEPDQPQPCGTCKYAHWADAKKGFCVKNPPSVSVTLIPQMTPPMVRGGPPGQSFQRIVATIYPEIGPGTLGCYAGRPKVAPVIGPAEPIKAPAT
jgi:hypothetical protein